VLYSLQDENEYIVQQVSVFIFYLVAGWPDYEG